MERLIDLHIHTNMSDGALSPKEIIDLAVKNDVGVIAIADHDSIDAFTEELYTYAESKNVKLINAVEISTRFGKAGIHVLGYNFDLNNEYFKSKLFKFRNARHDYLYNVAAKLKELGYSLNVEELDKIDAVTKAHIARDVVGNINNNELLLKTFGYIPQMGEFIETIMNEGCPAYVEKVTITPREASELIRTAGGKVVLAHPMAYKYEDNLSDEDIMSIIKDMGADGIEANYVYIDRDNNKIDESEKWNAIAKKYNLFSTIGSDFHNSDGIHAEIGLINENLRLGNEAIKIIIDNLCN